MSFETMATVYVFCNDYHEGQGSRLYRIQSKIRMNLKGDWQEWRAKELYKELEAKFAK